MQNELQVGPRLRPVSEREDAAGLQFEGGRLLEGLNNEDNLSMLPSGRQCALSTGKGGKDCKEANALTGLAGALSSCACTNNMLYMGMWGWGWVKQILCSWCLEPCLQVAGARYMPPSASSKMPKTAMHT